MYKVRERLLLLKRTAGGAAVAHARSGDKGRGNCNTVWGSRQPHQGKAETSLEVIERKPSRQQWTWQLPQENTAEKTAEAVKATIAAETGKRRLPVRRAAAMLPTL